MKTIVLGASGYIGSQLLKIATANGPCFGTSTHGGDGSLRAFDLKDVERSAEDLFGPGDVVFFTAAISAPDVCSREHDRAWAINVTATSHAIEIATCRGARVIFFSSDTVYGERDADFDESALCHPAGEYATMKHEVERHFAGHPQVKVLRLSYVFSRSDKFTQYLVRCAQTGVTAEIFHPFYRAVVHRDDVVDAAFALASQWEKTPQQIINVGGPDVIARTEFAETVRGVALPELAIRVTEPAPDFFVNRPRVIRMQSPFLETLLGRKPRSLRKAAQIEFTGEKDCK